MRTIKILTLGASAVLLSTMISLGAIKVVMDHNEEGTPAFKFKNVPVPSASDAASKAKFIIVDGELDPNSGGLDKLNDGKLPTEEDEPSENFFFAENTDGGRLLLDLGSAIDIKQVNTYSWHPNTRGPQVYKLYASDGTAEGFNAKPKKKTDPEKCGWKLIASVDTRSKDNVGGGQYGVSISDSEGALGKYRYLLFDCFETEADDDSGNTFYSEIDVVAKDGSAGPSAEMSIPKYVVHSPDGKCEITIDSSRAPELSDWATNKLAPVLAEWYPKIVALLPSEGYTAPTNFSVTLRPGRGVAATGGTHVTGNSTWYIDEIGREAIGSLVHEEVHVVQQYHHRVPGWIVEGVPDYIRWYLYEPQSHGCDMNTSNQVERARYDGMYRITANFLNWVVGKYGQDIITKLGAVGREGTYTDDLWKDWTGGQTLQDLNDAWKKTLEEHVAFLNWVSEKYDKQLVTQLNTANRQYKYTDDFWKQSTGKTEAELRDEWKKAAESKPAA